MSIASGVKVGVTVAWALSLAGVTMLVFITDRYRGGYEDMVNDAGALFFLGLALASGSAVAALVVRRKTPGALANVWLGFAVTHLALSVLFVGGTLILAKSSS